MLNPFRAQTEPVLSLEVQARLPANGRVHTRFEVLVRHLFHRFLNNELMSSDGESTRAVTLGYLIGLPELLVALFLFPAYHQPHEPRVYWSQVSDHYFFVVYSIVVMGIVAVSQWDLLFPDLLDIFVLSILPLRNRTLFFARVLAIIIFFTLVMLGANLLGFVFLPLVADRPSFRVHLLAHGAAIVMGSIFAASTFLAVQGVLLNVLGEKIFRRITPILQGLSVAALLALLFLYPTVSSHLQALLISGDSRVLYFPPFWFLAIYERILAGPSVLPVFRQLASMGFWYTWLMVSVAIVTYPLAYHRRVRQLIEGSTANASRTALSRPVNALLHHIILRSPARRAIFHFISQTIVRTQKQRVLIAMYGGVSVAFVLAEMLSFSTTQGHVTFGFLQKGTLEAIPIFIFWTVMGLRTALAAPVDRRASWVFRVILGRPTLEHLKGATIWVGVWCLMIGSATFVLLKASMSTFKMSAIGLTAQVIFTVGLTLLLTDRFFLKTTELPFTQSRKSSITEMPWVVVRYFVAFPLLVLISVNIQVWLQAGILNLAKGAVAIAVFHLWWAWRHSGHVREMRSGGDSENQEEFFQGLGLRD